MSGTPGLFIGHCGGQHRRSNFGTTLPWLRVRHISHVRPPRGCRLTLPLPSAPTLCICACDGWFPSQKSKTGPPEQGAAAGDFLQPSFFAPTPAVRPLRHDCAEQPCGCEPADRLVAHGAHRPEGAAEGRIGDGVVQHAGGGWARRRARGPTTGAGAVPGRAGVDERRLL